MNSLHKVKKRVLIISCIGSILLISSCSFFNSDDKTKERFEITNNEEEISERYTIRNDTIFVDTTAATGIPAKVQSGKRVRFNLKLVSEMDPPEINGNIVQATMVSRGISNTRYVVSYNQQGVAYQGAVDVLQLSGNGKNIRLRSNINFFDSDINAVVTDNFRLYTASATDNAELISNNNRSIIHSFLYFSGYAIDSFGDRTTELQSFAANSVSIFGDKIYVTSGSDGGLTVFEDDISNTEAFIPIEDARWVDVNSSYLTVLSGDTNSDNQGTVTVINKNSYEIINQYPFPGAYTPEAKNTLELINHLAIIAAGKEGVQVLDLTTGEIVASIPIPDPATIGLSPDVVATNAVSVDDDKLFISNGEAGVYVAEAPKDLRDYDPGDDFSLAMIGKLQFDDLESVNHVTYRNKLLVIAAGLGGTKVVSLSNKDRDDDDD